MDQRSRSVLITGSGVAAVVTAFIAIRLPLFSEAGRGLGWNSDAALFGLMARSVLAGADVPLFFWGQSYLATITAVLTAVLANVVTPGEVVPLTLRVAAAVEVLAAIGFYWLALRRTVGRAAAGLATAWLGAGPAFVAFFVIAPIGAEQLFFMSALLFWYVTRAELTRPVEWLILGMLCGAGMWVHQGIAFMILAIALALLQERRLSWTAVLWGTAGTTIGYLPAVVWWIGDHPILYRRAVGPWSLFRVGENIASTVSSDLWLLLADDSLAGKGVSLLLLVFAAIGARRVRWQRPQIIAGLTIAISFAFWIFSNYPYPGAVRYIAPAVPLLYGFAAVGIAEWWRSGSARRITAGVLGIVIAAGLYIPRYREAAAVEAGLAEQYKNWPGGFDPRPVAGELRARGYRVCFGEAWVAHKLEWISEPTVRFVPVRIVHRTLAQSLSLIRQPGPKCFVENDGTVRALSAGEEAAWRETVIARARRAGMTQ